MFGTADYLEFLKCTDQKERGALWIAERIHKTNCYSPPRDISILDIGSGTGVLIRKLVEHLRSSEVQTRLLLSLELVEPSRALTNTLLRLARELTVSDIAETRLVCSTLEEWLQNRRMPEFDLVLASHVLNYLQPPELDKTILQLVELLRPEGCLCVILTHAAGWIADLRSMVAAVAPEALQSGYMDHEEGVRLLKRHDLDVEIHSLPCCLELEAGDGAHAVSSTSARVVGMLTRVSPRFFARDDLPAEITSRLAQATEGCMLTDAYLWIRKPDRSTPTRAGDSETWSGRSLVV